MKTNFEICREAFQQATETEKLKCLDDWMNSCKTAKEAMEVYDSLPDDAPTSVSTYIFNRYSTIAMVEMANESQRNLFRAFAK